MVRNQTIRFKAKRIYLQFREYKSAKKEAKYAQNQNGRRDPAPLEEEEVELGLEEVELGLEVEEVEEVEVEFDPAGGQGRPLIVTPHL